MEEHMSRIEKDSMGSVEVPDDAWWGAQTQRAIQNFPISGLRFPRRFIEALARLKRAAARVNGDLGLLDAKLAAATAEAAGEVADGRWDAEFPLDVFQTGSGTSTNMNANEVIANLANVKLGGERGTKKPVHPNDHVNLGQSSNDMIPSAAHLSALLALHGELFPALDGLHAALDTKAKEFDSIIKLGRTHLMDAVPVRLGQEFGGYAMQVRKGSEQIRRVSEPLRELALGGTAVGTGMNAHPEFARRVCALLANETGLHLREARDHFEAQGSRDDLLMVSGALKGLACGLMKIANDLRWMGSGPLGGLGEILLPDLQPGSSIMPGKVNPVLCEVVTQVAAQVIGNDAAVTIAAQGGALELNVFIPVMAHNVLQAVDLLAASSLQFAKRCVSGIQANAERCEELAHKSLSLVTILNPVIGYDKAAELAKEAYRRRMGVKQLALEKKLITPEQAEKLFQLRPMTEPGLGGAKAGG
ncbi:MAG: class II fumarate hydratase [Planctomycetes bacterium]|nr:class II fumarate hydratase [Planctomycetota bacterium]